MKRTGAGLIAVIAALGAGCGGPSTTPPPGSAVTGTVGGQAFSGSAGSFDRLGDEALLLAIATTDGLCEFAQTVSIPTSDLRWLNVFLCVGVGVDPVGAYPVEPGGGGGGPCAGKLAWGEQRFWREGVFDVQPADGGTVSVTSVSEQRLTGSVTLTFGAEAVTGAFSADYCAALNGPDP
jgi:hypothetical protein